MDSPSNNDKENVKPEDNLPKTDILPKIYTVESELPMQILKM